MRGPGTAPLEPGPCRRRVLRLHSERSDRLVFGQGTGVLCLRNRKAISHLMLSNKIKVRPRTATLAGAILSCMVWCAIRGQANQNALNSSFISLAERTQRQNKLGIWSSAEQTERLDPKQIAIVICDMWDNHWCRGAANRVRKLAVRMVPVLAAARQHGILIIHAPSDTIDFYKDAPERRRAEMAPQIAIPPSRHAIEPSLPIDFADGGCDTSPPDKFYKAWTRENAIIPIMPADLISTDGTEVYRNLKDRNIKTVIYVGVHANICILQRPFAIRQMRAWGLHCLLMRDLTDAMYNPRDAPYVSHERGTESVIEHIERYLAPYILSTDFVMSLGLPPAHPASH